MNKMYHVSLTETQAILLQDLTKKKELSTNKKLRIEALRLLGHGLKDNQVAIAIGRSIPTIERVRKTFVLDGFDAVILHKKPRGRPLKLGAAGQELMIKFAQEEPPSGYARWTSKLLQKKLIHEGIVTSISVSTICRYLRVRRIKLHRKKIWCISKIDEKFVERAKVVIETYNRPYNKDNPVVCFDEKSYELKSDVRKPLPVSPGKPRREDNEWKRHGTVNIFMCCEPLRGSRYVKVTKRRTKKDFAKCMKTLVDKVYKHAEKITVVLDNLNTHTKKALTDSYGKDEGERIFKKLEFVKTPVHGSWLNMAEIELSALSTQSLARRIPSKAMLRREIRSWSRDRNTAKTPIKWTYSVEELYRLFEKIKAKQLPSPTHQN